MQLRLTIFAAFICLHSLHCQNVAPQINRFTILEDKNIEVTLLCYETASIDKDDWLKLVIKNKSKSVINILKADYSLFENLTTENGNPYEKNYVSADRIQLIYSFYESGNIPANKISSEINPGEELSCWKYLTNAASISLPADGNEKEMCPQFKFFLNYAIRDESIELNNPGTRICFKWNPETIISKTLLAGRLKRAIKDVYARSPNAELIKHLLKKPEVVALVSNKELEKGILGFAANSKDTEMLPLLQELKNRNAAPTPELTEIFRKDLSQSQKRYWHALQFYWDNTLLDTLLASGLNNYEVTHILDIHAADWSKSDKNCQKVYDTLANKTGFNNYMEFDSAKLTEWRSRVKLMAVSRDKRIIDHLAKLLDNEQTFLVEDWSQYALYGMLPKDAKPEMLRFRVCDIAYLSLLKATGLTEFSFLQMDKSNFFLISLDKAWLADNPADSVKFKFHAYEDKFRFMINAYDGIAAEKLVNLTPTLKANMKKYLEERKD